MTDTQSTWFGSLSSVLHQGISRTGQSIPIVPEQILIQEGEASTHLYLLESGSVELRSEKGGIVQLGPGSLVGEMAFLNNIPRTKTVTVREAGTARRIERTELMRAFVDRPEALNEMLTAISLLREERSGRPLNEGVSPSEFVDRLAAESLRHRAVRHPYLQALAENQVPDLRWALADFARQYASYSAHFPRYLTTVISRLEEPAHRSALMENLTEESGVYDEEELQELEAFGVERAWIVGIPHPLLFRRFALALGVEQGDQPESDQVVCWREMFLGILAGGSPAEGLGALGLGTENIVRTLYGPFVQAIRHLGNIAPKDSVFFPLHTAVDDHHQATLQEISAAYARNEEGRAGLRRGMLKALQLRSAFWDWMYARALEPERAHEVL